MEILKNEQTYRSATELIADMLVDPDKIDQFMEYLKTVQIGAKEVLFKEGEPANGMYFLEKGRVSVLQRLADGSTQRLRTYLSGTVVGEMGLYARIPRSAEVVADVQSHLFHLSLNRFKKMEIEAPSLSTRLHRFLVKLLALRLRSAELKISENYMSNTEC